mgnify:FL=1
MQGERDACCNGHILSKETEGETQNIEPRHIAHVDTTPRADRISHALIQLKHEPTFLQVTFGKAIAVS